MKLPSGLSHFLTSLEVLWREWNVQTLVITSLTFQLILVLVGPFRQKTSNSLIIGSIWLSYLLADWVAAQAVGLISRGNNDQGDLFPFWAQFLLLHLGGPDTVTALAVEDNDLWLRTGLHLGVQAYTTLGVLVKSLQHSKLWIPTILMFLAGIIKYLERVSALVCGRLMNFDKDPDHYVEELKAYEPQLVFVGPAQKDRTNVEMAKDAFYFFNYYKGLYADREIKYAMRVRSNRYLNSIRTSSDAFKVLEIQFHFAYEALYTKMVVIHKVTCWKILRPLVMLFNVACLVIWCFFEERNGFQSHDILITYALLIGAVFVDVLSIFRIQLSYWNIANLNEGSKIRRWVYNKMLSTAWRKEQVSFTRAFFRQWSESISQLSLINSTMDGRCTKMKKVVEFFGNKSAIDGFSYVTKTRFSDLMRDFIFDDLKCKLAWVHFDDKRASFICYARGSYAYYLRLPVPFDTLPNVGALLVVSHAYDFVLLRWHIITELCYYDEIRISDDDDDAEENLLKRFTNKSCKLGKAIKEEVQEKVPEMAICKTLSDYMMYLLLQKPSMVSALITGNTKQMVEDARQNVVPSFGMGRSKEARNRRAYARFREKITEGKTDSTPPPPEPPISSWAEFPYSIDAILKDLEALEEKAGNELKWKFIAEVWAELVYYAAIRCRPSVHAAQLKQGGELLSFIWLLMVQLGFGLHGSEHEAFQFQQQLLPRRFLRRRKRLVFDSDTKEPVAKKPSIDGHEGSKPGSVTLLSPVRLSTSPLTSSIHRSSSSYCNQIK